MSQKTQKQKDRAEKKVNKAIDSASRCELRPGIGICDCCGEPKWPQVYEGYGCMICLDCLDHKRHSQKWVMREDS